jgi:hypothetical protein
LARGDSWWLGHACEQSRRHEALVVAWMDMAALLCAVATQWWRACATQLGTAVEEEREQRLQRQWQLELWLRHGDGEAS